MAVRCTPENIIGVSEGRDKKYQAQNQGAPRSTRGSLSAAKHQSKGTIALLRSHITPQFQMLRNYYLLFFKLVYYFNTEARHD